MVGWDEIGMGWDVEVKEGMGRGGVRWARESEVGVGWGRRGWGWEGVGWGELGCGLTESGWVMCGYGMLPTDYCSPATCYYLLLTTTSSSLLPVLNPTFSSAGVAHRLCAPVEAPISHVPSALCIGFTHGLYASELYAPTLTDGV